uniref:Neurotransmitter-gated ion-channel ligand-binding domain-containing protein n=1 Tax=Ascaris lumbricoides TaxID=6252 RepID=A0A9J2PQM9_ASCLU
MIMRPSSGRRFNLDLSEIDGTATDEQKLLYHLLRQYEKAVRPVRNASHTVTVKLGMTMTNIFEMDEKNQVLTINVWLDQWCSSMCTILLTYIRDEFVSHSADDYTAGYMRSRAMVFYDGTVFWPPPTQLRSTCKIDVTYFPFDSQHCALKFGSWTYHGFQVDITNRSDNVDLSNYVVSGEFDLVRVHQKRRVVKYTCCPEPYPDVTFFIHIRRKTLYYLYNVVFPCMMMSVLTLLVFLLPPDSGEKIALGITVLLAFSVFVLAIAEKMPETSDSMPLIGIYLTVVMAMTSVSVVMTVMVLNFHHRGPFNQAVPKWVHRLVLNRLRRALCMRLPYTGWKDNGFCSANGMTKTISIGLAMDDFRTRQSIPANAELVNVDDAAALRKKKCRPNELHSRLLKTLQVLIRRQEMEDLYQTLANEWRQVAQVIDRLLFWVFLVCTVIITLILLIIIPAVHRSMESDVFDESLYGLH